MITDNNTRDYSQFRDVDRNCVKEKLKMDQNSGKIINENLAIALFISVAHLCANNPEEVYDMEMNQIPQRMMTILKDKIDCAKYALKEFEPDSEIIKNFNPDEMKTPKDECVKILEKYEFGKTNDLSQREKKMDTVVCGLWNESKNRIFMLKLFIVKIENLEEQKMKLKNYFKETISKIFDCVIAKI
ncbi:hypothetical protein PVAND_014616 [Polypedilum vanderplanki]|uniref:Uncharacterized protein n=1 Tax=Polypedilum vanderplanki TaxID=319348 RepID=A0A9J6BAG3_POLVA|nr:hypothetical protein PVAND_014616 [Polypedilum vanderplanki]